ncbi:uncharacterized protein LOC116164026 [Photinus pyralis]|uniref:uncharacterized protein LOC116164026 n=1 Tax=Photinus pyralis TaxID=7054 RepID=UPI00126753CF|nr:uncharacterized protein LOC116164026 [Photinus pyralis]
MSDYDIDVLAVQETKQKGQQVIPVDNFTFYNSGGASRYLGVGFLINSEIKDAIVDFEAVNDRICRLRVRGRYRKITIVNIHSPTEDKELTVKSEFYEEVGRILERTPKYDVKIVLGDLNAKIEREEEYIKVTGGNSKHHESNENGKIAIQFALENKLKVMSTNFKHREIHQTTWISPDAKTKSQIDHVLMESKHQRYIQNVRSYRGADIDSDHILIIATLRQGPPKNWKAAKTTLVKYNVEKLLNQEVQTEAAKQLDYTLKKLQKPDNIEEEWSQMENTLKDTMEKLVGRKTKGKQKDWFDEQCRKILQVRNEARMKLLIHSTETNKREYKEARRRSKQICRQKKREYLEAKLEKIGKMYANKELRNFYQEAKRNREDSKPSSIPHLKNKEGEMIGNTHDKVRIFMQYYGRLERDEEEQEREEDEKMQERIEEGSNHEGIMEPTKAEVIEELNNLKNYKSTGENGIPAELYKWGGERLKQTVTNLIIKACHRNGITRSYA